MQESIGELLAPSWRPALAPTALFARAVTQAIGCPRAIDHVAPGLRARSRSSDLAVGEPVLRFVVFTLRGKKPGLDPLLRRRMHRWWDSPLRGTVSPYRPAEPTSQFSLGCRGGMPRRKPRLHRGDSRCVGVSFDQLSFRTARFRASTHVRGWIHNPGGNER